MKITTFLITICLVFASCAPIQSAKSQIQATPIINATASGSLVETANSNRVAQQNHRGAWHASHRVGRLATATVRHNSPSQIARQNPQLRAHHLNRVGEP